MYPLWEPLLTYQFQLFTSFFLLSSFWRWVHPKSFDHCVFSENPNPGTSQKSASWSLWFVKYVKDIRNTMAPNKVLAKPTSTCSGGKNAAAVFSPGTVFLCVFCYVFWGKGNGKLATMLSNTQKPPGDFVFETVLKEQIPINNDHKNTPNNPWTSIVLKMFPMQKGDLY